MSCAKRNRTMIAMRSKPARVVWFFLAVYLLWLLPGTIALAAELEQKQGSATLRLEAETVKSDRVEIRLSDEIRLTMSMEGDAGLEVQPPEPRTTSPDWQVRREFAPERVPLPGGHVRWQERFRLSPLKPGDLSLALAPLRYRLSPDTEDWQEIAWRPIPVHVSTEI
ncbi:MAG TPA: hypothetical protein VKU02_02280, partial [Gemmataceae bacterium]|nr:hypothetical protein [Gemmataceae bacterium]